MNQMVQTRNDFRLSNNPYLLIEAMMIKLTRYHEIQDIASLISNLKQGGLPASTPSSIIPKPVSRPEEKPVYSPQPAATKAPEPEVLHKLDYNEQSVRENWNKVVSRMKKSSAITGHTLENAKILRVNETSITIQLDSIVKHNAIKPNIERIQGIILDLFGKSIHLQVVLEEIEAPTKVDIKRKTIDEVKAENPEIAGFVDQTNARLI